MSRNKDCGAAAKKVEKAKEIKIRALRSKSILNFRMRRMAENKKNLAIPHKRGAALSRAEKEVVLHAYESFKSECFFRSSYFLLA